MNSASDAPDTLPATLLVGIANPDTVPLLMGVAGRVARFTDASVFATHIVTVPMQMTLSAARNSPEVARSSELLRVVVDDATPDNGEVWESEDGGNSWRPVTELTNQGYNAAYLFQDIDKMLIVGDASGGTGVVHLLS